MRKFIQKALEKLSKMDKEQIKDILCRISNENELLEMVLNSMTDGVIVTDRQYHVLLYNKSIARMFLINLDETSEEKIWEIIDDREIAAFFREKLTNQEKVIDKEFTLEERINRVISVSIMPLVRDKRVQGNLIHIEDVTEKRSKEARLRRAENLAALTTLAAGVAHEIKNPLGSIGIHIQLIQKEMRNKKMVKTEMVKEYLSVITEEVDRLNRIVVDFLFAVRPMDTNLEEKNINQVVKEIFNFVQYELKESGVNLKIKLGEELPKIKIDEKYIKQAILNLVKNSMYAMPNGGLLTVETLRAGGNVLLKISDTGSGIPDELMDKIFEPYFTTKDFGTGLGLTLVYKIVKEHLGEISVNSKEGEGTTFTISFPIPQKEKRLIDYKGEAV
ncbi:MAG: PAS domain-containing sensor histidine kinase [Spirochaetes bacterium]|nr:MAG: PAS domain-containing sensor histidine kinase [Spirochaetota bacterium]